MKEAVVEQQQRNDKPKTAEVGSSHEEGELTPKNDMHLNNGHGTSSKLCISPNQHSYSDDSDKSRCLLLHICVFVALTLSLELTT